MSIANGQADVRNRKAAAERRTRELLAFRSRQRSLDRLAVRLKVLILKGVEEVTPELAAGAADVLAQVHGSVPPWLRDERSTLQLANQVLIAKGVLHRSWHRSTVTEPDPDETAGALHDEGDAG